MNVVMTRNPDLLRTKAAEAAHLLEMMANPRRLMILCELADGERSVSDLVPVVDLQPAALSQHLARLRAAGLVSTRRASQMIYYRLANPAVIAVINTLAAVFCPDRTSKRRNTA